MKTLQVIAQILFFVVVLAGIGLFVAGGHSGVIDDSTIVVVKRDAEIVEEWLVLPEHRAIWRSDVKSSRATSGTQVAVGFETNDVFLSHGSEVQGTTKVTAFEPEKEIVLEESTDAYDATWTYTLKDSGRRTRIDAAVEVRNKGFLRKLFSPIAGFSLGDHMREDLDVLVRKAEADYGG